MKMDRVLLLGSFANEIISKIGDIDSLNLQESHLKLIEAADFHVEPYENDGHVTLKCPCPYLADLSSHLFPLAQREAG